MGENRATGRKGDVSVRRADRDVEPVVRRTVQRSGRESFHRSVGDTRLDSKIARLYNEPLPSTRTGPLYNAFSYPTKISPETIALFIATHTRPGDVVLDPFAGSGTTGIATKLCDKPTEAMVNLAAQLGIEPVWGPRHAVLYELGVLGSSVSEVMCSPPDPERFRVAATALLDAAEASHAWFYDTIDPDGARGTMRHIIWSDVLVCPSCSTETTYWEGAVRRDPLRLERSFTCGDCGVETQVSRCERAVDRVYDHLLDREVEQKRRVPAVVYGSTGKTKWKRPAVPDDEFACERAAKEPIPSSAPCAEIEWGDLFRSGYHRGMTHLHHFYTPRNFLALATLWDLVDDFEEDVRPALRLLILSFNATHSTLMTRVVVKRGQRDFVLTGAQSGVLYVSSLPVEKNVFEGIRRKAKTFFDAFETVRGSESTVSVVNASSTSLGLPEGSVQYVFTDPPFGGYIPYAEINQLNEAWFGTMTDREAEIIMSPAQGKDVVKYGGMMAEVFAEISRVLDDDGQATVVFHSAKADVWEALINAYDGAGLSVRTASVLDKTQASFKQVVSDVTVKGDPLILLGRTKRRVDSSRLESVEEVAAIVLSEAHASRVPAERTRERLFSRFVSRCLVEGVAVTVGAADFYELADLRGGSV